MTPASEAHCRYRRQIALQIGVCWAVVPLVAAWAWWVPSPIDATVTPLHVSTTISSAPLTPGINPAHWNVMLWHPFGTELSAATSPTNASAFALYSIMQQGDGFTAAMSAGPQQNMILVKAGDIINGATVVRIEANAVVLRLDGQDQRLGLSP